MDIGNKQIQLEFIKNLSWPEVFEIWRKNEKSRPNWEKHFKSRGFSSWEEWRSKYAEAFRCAEAKWVLYKITNPVRDVPLFYGGPFRAWIERFYKDKKTMTFRRLADLPDIQVHQGTDEMVANFPKDTKITGLIVDGEIYIIEGMHRCAALALMNQRGLKHDSDVFITLAQSPSTKLPPVVGGFKKTH